MSSSSSWVVRRMVNLPRSILGLMGIGNRRNNNNNNNNYYPMIPTAQYNHHPQAAADEFAFLNSFEQQYGTKHPFFYACGFTDALKIAKDEHKLLFLYLHSQSHPFTPSFCRDTLCCEVVVQFLDANYVCWGALAHTGQGFHMASTLGASTYPFCAIVAPASDLSINVLQQMEGPMSPAELLEILHRTMEEQGLAFGSNVAKQQEKLRADRRLREEQDLAYIASLQIDQEKEKLKMSKIFENHENMKQENQTKNVRNSSEMSSQTQQRKVRDNTISFGKGTLQKKDTDKVKNVQMTQILIRFPNGERKEQSFQSKDKIQAIYRYIDSLGMPGVGNYRLISNFPRKVYGLDQMGMTLIDAGLHPKASIFLEILEN